MVNIIIFGFSYSGINEIKKIISRDDSIYEYMNDCDYITDEIRNSTNRDNIIISSIYTKDIFFTSKYNEYIKIFILRNPYYIYSYINNEYSILTEQDTINNYIATSKLFFNYNNKINNLFCIKYEDISKDSNIFKNILDKYNINCELNSSDLNKFKDNIEDINLKLENEKELNNSIIVQKIGYTNPKYKMHEIIKIYVIHLKKSIEREIHFKEEFKKMNILNYEVFNATEHTDEDVKEKITSGFVKKFPPCFRCNKMTCNCKNKVLCPRQIGNWCSFINVMKKIINDKTDGLIMICEDDIKFMNNYPVLIKKLLRYTTFNNYKIDINKPLLIRLGNSLAVKLDNNAINIILTNEILMANPCFIINRQFAESFINNLSQINTTSDMYIHKNLIKKDKTIQSFTIIPQLAHELSYSNKRIFNSEIRVK